MSKHQGLLGSTIRMYPTVHQRGASWGQGGKVKRTDFRESHYQCAYVLYRQIFKSSRVLQYYLFLHLTIFMNRAPWVTLLEDLPPLCLSKVQVPNSPVGSGVVPWFWECGAGSFWARTRNRDVSYMLDVMPMWCDVIPNTLPAFPRYGREDLCQNTHPILGMYCTSQQHFGKTHTISNISWLVRKICCQRRQSEYTDWLKTPK